MSNEVEGKFDKPSLVLQKEENPKAYKLLKYKSKRHVTPGNWIINKNSFNNVAPPDDYKESSDEEETYHMSEWLNSSSETDNLNLSSNRAIINYIRGYSYQAPNNPHINKNYEGTPILSTSDIDSIRFERYKYRDGFDGSKKNFIAAPYFYEDISGEDIGLVRSNIKGGNYITSKDDSDDRAFSKGSRIRITKYVYKIYTKNAVLLGDLGASDSYGSQRGWDYKLQYSTNSGNSWNEIEPTEGSFVERLFYNNSYLDTRSDSFNNTQVVNSMPCVMLKTNITRKYKPEQIEFRITKKQNVELQNDLTKVVKKLNFLPLDVSMPTSETLVNITQQATDTAIDSAGDAVVTLDPTREYHLIKSANEKVYKDSVNELKIEELKTDANGNIISEESDLKDKPIALAGLSGVRIRKDAGFSSSLSNISTVIGPKPSGLLLTRKEDSHLGAQTEAELFELAPDQTRTFITPSITGSHFDELKDNNNKIINFSCSSATTGDSETSTLTNVNSLTFSPLDNFYNSPIITSSITATEDDKDKTFIVSGATITNNVGASVLDITTEETPIPIATIEAENEPVIVEGCSKVTIDGGEENFTTNNVINLSTGDLSVVTNGNSENVDDSIIIEHDKIKLTSDDQNITGVIDCSSDLVLPKEFTNTKHITFLNAGIYETKVLAENSSHTINSKLTDYIPPKQAKKFTYNNNNWVASDIEVIKYNQLNLTNSDFSINGKTIIHNEDVDVHITGSITSGRYLSIVRNQVENFDIESDREDWVTPVMRIFKDGVLKYTAPNNSLGTRIKYNGSNLEFKDIKPIVFNEVSVSPGDSQKVYSYSGESGSMDFKFSDGAYRGGFEIFITSKKDAEEDVLIGLTSDNESVKFINIDGEEIGFYYDTPISKERVVSIRQKNNFTFVVQELDQSDRYKFDQPADSDTKVLINRSENFGLELPTINTQTDDAGGFDMVFLNASREKALVSLPKEASSVGERVNITQVSEFSTSNYFYDTEERQETEYNNIKYTEKSQSHNQDLSDGDFIVLDHSLSNVHLESSIKKDFYSKKNHKYSKSNMNTLFNLEGEFVDYLSFNTDTFTLKNHELVSRQKFTFNCEKVIVADHYYEGNPDAYTTNSNNYSEGQTILVFYNDVYYFTYFDTSSGSAKLKKTNFDFPESFSDILTDEDSDSGSRNLVASDLTNNGAQFKLFAFIKNGTSGSSEQGEIYDFHDNTGGLNPANEINTSFVLSNSADDDSSELRKQTYFVKVVDGNNIKLYKNSDLTGNPLSTDDTILSDTFYVSNIDTSSLSLINLGESKSVKTFSDDESIADSLAADKSVSIQQHYSNIYSSGAAVASGVHYVTGYTEDTNTDTCSIENLEGKDTVFLSGKFHAKADLNDNNFNNNYYINAGLSKVAISNTNPGNNTKYEIKKNKVAKHTNDGAFQVQNQNTDNRDLIYYPKHELHVLDRKFLSKAASSGLEYNFVFFKPDEHSDDLKIVLPNDWTNLDDLDGSGTGKIAIVNLHDRPVRVENFSNTANCSFTLNSDSVAWINSSANYSDENTNPSPRTEDSLFNVTEITKNSIKYTFDIDEDSKIAKVNKAEFFIMKPGDIIIDHSIHDDKKILVDGDINFLRPYVSNNEGTENYAQDGYNKDTKFFISNISKEPINVNINYESADSYGIENLTSEGKLHSSKFYTAELAQFASDDEYGEYFSYIEIEQDAAEGTDFTYSSADLNSAKKYNIFGIQCPINVHFYYESLSTADDKKLYDYFLKDFSNETLYRISSIGELSLNKLSIVNTVYEDISLKTKAYDSSDKTTEQTALSSSLQSFIDQKIIPSKGTFRSYTYTGGQFDTYYDQDLAPTLLPKNKAITLSLKELLSPEGSAYENTGCSAFGLSASSVDFGTIADQDIDTYQSSFFDVAFKDVKVLKSKENKALFLDASVDGEVKNRAIISVMDGSSISLPRRKLITRNFDFIVINGSRSSIEINSPEGTGVFSTTSNISLASGKFIKVSYASGVFTPSLPSDCTVIARGIYRKDLRALVVVRQSSNFVINKGIESINIINNSGAGLGLKLFEENKTLQVDKDKQMVVKTEAEGASIVNKSNIHRAIKYIKDGTVELSSALYKNETVLFNDEAVRFFDLGDSFFKTDYVPFVSSKNTERPSLVSVSYKGFGIFKTGQEKNIPPIGPVSSSSTAITIMPIEITCGLLEFKLSQANDKILLPKKNFDYIADNDKNISLSLYNKFEEDSRLYQINSSGELSYDESNDIYTSELLYAQNLYNVTQSGTNLSITRKQSYIDVTSERPEDEDLFAEDLPFLARRFYCNKQHYLNKTIVFKDPFEINGEAVSGSVFVNASKNKCISLGQGDSVSYIEPNLYKKPKYSITPNANKVFILTHNADVKVNSVDNLKIANISNRKINVTDGENNYIVYSCERADFASATDITYSEIRKQRREDWFIKLEGIDIPHLIEDPTYFDEKEWQMEMSLEKRGINVNYTGARYKFSNIFNTNKNFPQEGQTGFQTIEDFNDAYKFGVTLFSNQRGVKREILFAKDTSSSMAPMYMKIPWDMKQDIIAYSLNTGHEKIIKCSHFNERTGEITLSGFKPDRYHSFESEQSFDYDFVYDLDQPEDPKNEQAFISNSKRIFNNKEYKEKNYSEPVVLTYQGEEYFAGQKIKGVSGASEYKIKLPYYLDLSVSQFLIEQIDDSAEDKGYLEAEKKKFTEEATEKINDTSSSVKSPAWSKVSSDKHKANFLNAVVDKKIAANSSYELIQGRQLKDIEGVYVNEVDKKAEGANTEAEGQQSLWDYTKNFEFTIPLLKGANYTKNVVGDEEIKINNSESIAKVKVKLVGWVGKQRNMSSIESPAFEYKIKSSLSFTSASELLQLSIEDKDSTPFSPDGVIRSLNEDFSSAVSEEESVKAFDRLKAKYEQQSKEVRDADERTLPLDEYIAANQIEINRRNNKAHLSLKNNNGHSFVPFRVHSGADPMIGFRYNIERGKPSYRSVRFRLKKLTNKKIVFNDLTKDEKIGTYLTNNKDKAKLNYVLESEVESIAYQDIARPGGVAKLNTFGSWNDVVHEEKNLTGAGNSNYIKLNNVDNGDAIIFENSSGNIIKGRVYFLRVAAWGKEGGSRTGSNLYDVLNVFTNDNNYDSINIINSGLVGNRYKIVNYFNLERQLDSKEVPVEGHRGKRPVINNVYNQGLEETASTTLNFPIIVNNKRFYLERPSYKDYSKNTQAVSGYGEQNTDESFDSWPDNIYNQNGETFSVRANLELSAVAESLVSDLSDVRNKYLLTTDASATLPEELSSRSQLIDYEEEKNWHELNIFQSFKNILFRDNTLIDFVDISNRVVRIVVDITKGKEYRYILNRDGISQEEAHITINGSQILVGRGNVDDTADKLGYFIAEDDKIEISYKFFDDVDLSRFFYFSATNNEFQNSNLKVQVLQEIIESIFITESAFYVDQIKKSKTGDNLSASEYMDYQIPNLNNYNGDSSNALFSPSSFVYTEKLDRLFSFDKKYELLTDSNTVHGLAYDGPMPATVKYIYPIVLDGGQEMSFSLDADHVKGFLNGFESPKTDGSASFRNKPETIKFNLEELTTNESGDTWSEVDLDITIEVKRVMRIKCPDKTKTYRLKITKEIFEYYEEADLKTFSNDLMRVPFTWTSLIRHKDIESLVDAKNNQFSLDLAENHKISNSISIPKDGVTLFGSHEYSRIADNYDFEVPHERLYKYRISHRLKASYVDKIAVGGISRVNIDSSGSDYRVAPEVTIKKPEEEEGVLSKQAKAIAHVESGKITHVEVVDSGAGYSDISSESGKQKVIDRSKGQTPFVFHSITIQDSSFTHSFNLTSGSKTVSHDGIKNIILGARVIGSGVVSGSKVQSVDSATQFTLSLAATSTQTSNLQIDYKERQMPYISLSEHKGVKTAPVSISYTQPEAECQEEFGILAPEAEALAEYIEDSFSSNPESSSDLADFETTLTRYVNTINAVSESDNWNSVEDINRKIKEIEDNNNTNKLEQEDSKAYSLSTEDEYSDLLGTENPKFAGLYEADEREESEQLSHAVSDEGDCIKQVFPEPSVASLTAIVNNNSIAEYRVVKNETANKSQPWLSSFSREQEPSLPKGFGINPGSPVTSEVFNNYARTVNNMRFLGAFVPVFAKVRKYRKYEYRYVSDMGQMTFASDNPVLAGDDYPRMSNEQEALSYKHLSKQNYIDFYDHKKKRYNRAWFSGFESDGLGTAKKNIQDKIKYELDLEAKNNTYNPPDLGLPNKVNIPEENGVFCFPAVYGDASGDSAGEVLLQGEGLRLPDLNSRRAFAFGGELVFESEEYDVTSETIDTDTSIVNIAGSEVIDSSYENELIFGCQVKGKPFWSTFLRTKIEWTEFEIVPSPSFLKSAVGEDGLGKIENINGTILQTRGICKNEKIGTVNKEEGYHSLCTDGANRGGMTDSQSYEQYFGLAEGDDIIGPSMEEFEFSMRERIDPSAGKQVFRIEPEFTQALAVYGTNETELIIRRSNGLSNPNFQAGPCIHKCSPFGRKVFMISDEQLKFDLMKNG